ncbi:MAG: DUF3881 family protein [Lachnospiraceae bacterium]|nr:DUF3881 family protein [Lachnospiraceae bacterium]
MHRFLRSIGFTDIKGPAEVENLLKLVVKCNHSKEFFTREDGITIGQYRMEFGNGFGIAVCGEFDEDDQFYMDHYYPYLNSMSVSSEEDVSIERLGANDAYMGVCDDMKMGITMIFYLQHSIPYLKAQAKGLTNGSHLTVALSALAETGTILMPITKNDQPKNKGLKKGKDRRTLLKEAKAGNEEAIETLTLGDMDLYSAITKKIRTNDLYTLVDTSFMPYGVECDQYSIIGEIRSVRKSGNRMTGKSVYVMQILVNETLMDLCIDEEDLYGEPEVGRRFKGNIWLQGLLMGDGLQYDSDPE